ncbi:WUSCHEL-related homeobox like [Quillaja saponaria]|uniref:WUSCHEL-related homeobox like n=1 Tax=Quillaja saponaria TaxID=32244 RepID=A0AAD7LGY5_QUISA|nr:WUSCHEL-related homeobox like [Quillaja saponaria]
MEWHNEEQNLHMQEALKMEQHQPQQHSSSPNNINVNINGVGVGVGGLYHVKVMTDDQMELLRRQISLYATICEQLVEMHKAVTAQQDFTGLRLGNLYCDPLVSSISGHKITARQRWTPTPLQLQILERHFDEGNGTPTKHKIKEITTELGQHGQISETNVYNWFQNRRARSKRKQLAGTSNTAESEVETEVESPKEKKTRPEAIMSFENDTTHSPVPPPTSRAAKNIYYQTPPETGIEQLIGKIESPGCYSSYFQGDEFDLVG